MERGKFVFNPGDIKDKVTNSLDVLKWTPLLTTTDEGVSILGSGPSVIYINGRRPVEGQEGALDMLKSTSPSLIRRIEIVTMAGSSQSASSDSGIVNIIIDNPSEGWRGSVTGKLDYTDERFSPSGTLWLYNATGKLRTSGSLVYSGKATNNEMESWYQYGIGGKTVTNNDKTTGWRDAIRLNVNATYDINSKSLAGVSLSLRETKKHTNSATTTVSEENGIKTKSESLIESRSPFLRPNLVVRGFYELAAGPKGSKLEIRGDFSSNVSKNERKYSIDGDIDNEIYKDNSRGIHASADYSWKINKDHRLKVGYDYAGSRLGYTLSADDSEREFIYRESINSAYAEWSSSWTNAIYTSLGVRMEDSDIKGDMKTSDDSYARHYTDLFPSFRIGINIPKGSQNISLGFERDIRRPYYEWMNPYKVWTSDNTYTQGNPDLKACYNWYYSLTYSFLKNFSAGLRFKHENGCITEYTYKYDGNTVSSFANTGESKRISSFISYMNTFFKIWDMRAEVYYAHENRKAEAYGKNIGYIHNMVELSMMNNVTLSKKHKWNLMLMGRVISPFRAVTTEGDWFNLVSVELSKSFRNGLSLNLMLSNITNFKNNRHYYSTDYSYKKLTKTNMQSAYLTVRYTFGKRKVRSAKTLFQTSIESRSLDN